MRPQTQKIAVMFRNTVKQSVDLTADNLAQHMGRVSPRVQDIMYRSGKPAVQRVVDTLSRMGNTTAALGLAGLTGGGVYGAMRPIKREEREDGGDRVSSIARKALIGGLLGGGAGLVGTAPGYYRAVSDMVDKGYKPPSTT